MPVVFLPTKEKPFGLPVGPHKLSGPPRAQRTHAWRNVSQAKHCKPSSHQATNPNLNKTTPPKKKNSIEWKSKKSHLQKANYSAEPLHSRRPLIRPGVPTPADLQSQIRPVRRATLSEDPRLIRWLLKSGDLWGDRSCWFGAFSSAKTPERSAQECRTIPTTGYKHLALPGGVATPAIGGHNPITRLNQAPDKWMLSTRGVSPGISPIGAFTVFF